MTDNEGKLHGLNWNRKVDPEAYSAGDMPLYPARVLILHCLMKGIQLGSVAGMGVFPIWKVYKKVPWSVALRSCMPRSIVGGTAISMGLLGAKAYQGALVSVPSIFFPSTLTLEISLVGCGRGGRSRLSHRS